MEYITEQFNLNMRKAIFYSKNAHMQYEFVVEEASLESPEVANHIINEAAGVLVERVKEVFNKIIEAIKRFFNSLIEKVKSFFNGNKEEKIKKAVQNNPALAKEKVEVPDIKEIEAVCGKRAMLRKKMIAEYKAGKLTRDRFNELVEQNEKLGKRLKTVGVVTLAIGVVIGGAFAASKLIPKLKKTNTATENMVKEVEQNAINEQSKDDKEHVTGVEVARTITKEITEEEQIGLQTQLGAIDSVEKKCTNDDSRDSVGDIVHLMRGVINGKINLKKTKQEILRLEKEYGDKVFPDFDIEKKEKPWD